MPRLAVTPSQATILRHPAVVKGKPRSDVKTTFDTGSREVTPDQVDHLAVIALIRSTAPLPPIRARCSWSKATPMPWAPRLTTCLYQTGARNRSRFCSLSCSLCLQRKSDESFCYWQTRTLG
jgi:hypothetical protein